MSTMRELKGRIGSVESSQKITGAMKMISSAKLRKAEQALRGMAPYREQLQLTINNLLEAEREYESPLTQERPVHRVALVLLASDEGLCGAYNSNLYKALLSRLSELRATCSGQLAIDVYPVGKKVMSAVEHTAGITVCRKDYFHAKSTPDELKQLVGELTASFLSGEYDRIECIYTHYKSVATQTVRTRQLLPIRVEEMQSAGKTAARVTPYIYEPDGAAIFETVLPLFVNASLIEACLQSRTSEQGARILAMQTASDNAGKLIDELRIEYNKLRQQGITNELLDIMGGSVR